MPKLSIVIATALALATALPAVTADHDTFLVGFDSVTSYGDPVTLKAQLVEPDSDCPAPGCPKDGRQVDFYVNDEYVGTDVTNDGGFAYLRLDAAQAWHAGEHEVRAQYDRESRPYDPATVLTTLTILAEDTILTARDGYFEAQLTDDDNEALVGFPVTFWKDDQEVCTAFTDATGTARCVGVTGAGVSRVGVDATQYTATFAGTDDYAGASATANLL